ncbi:vitellogenin-like [Dendrobates tinctorius]|uniref:vitellogenin-like n=1 Tax=Dendrobates tinctorius TaxID=92724 RepID=UPI003CC993EF
MLIPIVLFLTVKKFFLLFTLLGTGQLAFQKGYKYIYSYSAITETFLQGISGKSLLKLQCFVQIEVVGKCQMLLKIHNAHLKANLTTQQDSEKEFHELRDNLEKHPLQFTYHDGKISKICPVREEKTWALNVKRGILSILQGNLKAPSAGRTIEEVDVLGKCPTTYEFRGQSVWKKKDLTQCTNSKLGSISLKSVALPGKTQILDSYLECVQVFKGGVLAEATCNEFHLVTLFSRKGIGAKTSAKTILKLQKTDVDTISNKETLGRVYVTNLMYEKETGPSKPGGEDAAETVRNLCQSSHLNYELLRVISILEICSLSLFPSSNKGITVSITQEDDIVSETYWATDLGTTEIQVCVTSLAA